MSKSSFAFFFSVGKYHVQSSTESFCLYLSLFKRSYNSFVSIVFPYYRNMGCTYSKTAVKGQSLGGVGMHPQRWVVFGWSHLFYYLLKEYNFFWIFEIFAHEGYIFLNILEIFIIFYCNFLNNMIIFF